MAASDKETPRRIRAATVVSESVETNGHDEREENLEEDEALKAALKAVPKGKTLEWYARMSAVFSHKSAESAAAAFQMSGQAFGAADEARKESLTTRKFVQQMMEDNPSFHFAAKRTVSGNIRAVSIPPPIVFPENRSPTGHNFIVPNEEIEALKKQIAETARLGAEREQASAEREAAADERAVVERAQKELLEKQAQERKEEREKAAERRSTITTVAITLTFIGTAILAVAKYVHL
jgi:hypothetical protein